jgi:TonB family protein
LRIAYRFIPLCLFCIFAFSISVFAQNHTQAPSQINDFIRGAESGNEILQYYLAQDYLSGRLVPQSTEEALKWFRKSAERGYLNAQRSLAKIFLNKMVSEKLSGIEESKKEVLYWYRKAAEQGDVDSQCSLGRMLAREASPDYVEAFGWLDICLSGSIDKPRKEDTKIRADLEMKMSAAQIAEARRMADEWASRYMQSLGNGPYKTGWGVSLPKILSQSQPPYTSEARQLQIQGSVLIEVIIRKDGALDGFRVLKGLGYGLDESVIDTVSRRWRFSPGTYQGKSVDVKGQIEVVFSIH